MAYATDRMTTHRVVSITADPARELPAVLRRMADVLDATNLEKTPLHDMTCVEGSDTDGWPVWTLTAYLHVKEG